MRVIWATPSLPHPHGTGGCVHEFSLISALASSHDIHVVTSDPPGPLDSGPVEAVAASFTRVAWTQKPYPATRAGIAVELLRADPNLLVWLNRDRLRALAGCIRNIAERQRADLVNVTIGEIAPIVDALTTPTALLLFDSLTREIERRLEVEPRRYRRARLQLERWRTERFERHWYRRATSVASVSEADAEWLEHKLGRPIEVIENSVPVEMFETPRGTRRPALVTFVGTLNHPPNTDAVEWLVADIWPRVVAQRPDAELCVAGRGDREGVVTARLRTLVEGAGGRLAVDVADIRPYYWNAAVIVAPVRTGAGMRTKVIHAAATRTPVVAAPPALEGLSDAVRDNVVCGSSPSDIADAVVGVLNDSVTALDRAEAAAVAVGGLGVDAVAERLERWWKSIA